MKPTRSDATAERYSPLYQLVLGRVREFYREPIAIFWVYGFPLIMAVALGVAFRDRPVDSVPVDVQSGPGAETVAGRLRAADTPFKVAIHDAATCQKRLQLARTDLVVAASADVSRPDRPRYQYWFDRNRPESVAARFAADSVLARAAAGDDAPPVESHPLEETGGSYINFLIPGLIGMNLMGGGLWGVGFALVDMRVRKLLKRLLATPMKKSHFLLGIGISRLLFTIPEVVLLLVFARLVFGVKVHGDLASLAAVVVLGATSFAGLGLLVACRANTIETVSGLMNLVQLPMFVLSGVFFSSERFPAVLQPVIKLLPLTALNDALRGIMMEGDLLVTRWRELIVLAAWGGVSFVLALRWFRWT